jgi:hypothetical protein
LSVGNFTTMSPFNPVSPTSDESGANQMTVQRLLKSYGTSGTFYLNSPSIGVPAVHMTRGGADQLSAISLSSGEEEEVGK